MVGGRVGAALGARVGAAVGAADGVVGVAVGSAVGAAVVGAPVGMGVGDSLGMLVVGAAVGASVGAEDGPEGAAVGSAVGVVGAVHQVSRDVMMASTQSPRVGVAVGAAVVGPAQSCCSAALAWATACDAASYGQWVPLRASKCQAPPRSRRAPVGLVGAAVLGAAQRHTALQSVRAGASGGGSRSDRQWERLRRGASVRLTRVHEARGAHQRAGRWVDEWGCWWALCKRDSRALEPVSPDRKLPASRRVGESANPHASATDARTQTRACDVRAPVGALEGPLGAAVGAAVGAVRASGQLGVPREAPAANTHRASGAGWAPMRARLWLERRSAPPWSGWLWTAGWTANSSGFPLGRPTWALTSAKKSAKPSAKPSALRGRKRVTCASRRARAACRAPFEGPARPHATRKRRAPRWMRSRATAHRWARPMARRWARRTRPVTIVAGRREQLHAHGRRRPVCLRVEQAT
jgi:hypothetical protein